VGVVTDIRSAPRAQPQSIIYWPVQQEPPPWMSITVEGDARLCAAALTTRFLSTMLFGVTPLDPATFLAAGLLFLTVSAPASFVPARRAVTVSPAVALRTE
jgi:hypothetical protein